MKYYARGELREECGGCNGGRFHVVGPLPPNHPSLRCMFCNGLGYKVIKDRWEVKREKEAEEERKRADAKKMKAAADAAVKAAADAKKQAAADAQRKSNGKEFPGSARAASSVDKDGTRQGYRAIAYLLVAFIGGAIIYDLLRKWFPTMEKEASGWVAVGLGALLGFFWKYVLALAMLLGSALLCWEVFVKG